MSLHTSYYGSRKIPLIQLSHLKMDEKYYQIFFLERNNYSLNNYNGLEIMINHDSGTKKENNFLSQHSAECSQQSLQLLKTIRILEVEYTELIKKSLRRVYLHKCQKTIAN